MYKQKRILFAGMSSNAPLLSLFSRDNITEVVSSVSFIESISQRFFPDLIVLDSLPSPEIKDVRGTERLLGVPVLVSVLSLEQENNLNSITMIPRVILCNSCVATHEDFVRHILLVAEKKIPVLPCRTGAIVKYAILYMNKNIGRRLTRESIAGQLGVAGDYLSRIFKQEMGLTLWDYLTTLRLERARTMLLQTGERVVAVAESCGFDDASYFNRVFKKHYGLTPSALRLKN